MSARNVAPRNATRSEIPILDLQPAIRRGDVRSVAGDVRRACETTGFFYIYNHGVAPEVVRAAFAASRRYFSLPLEQRLNHKIDERYRRGFMPQGINQQTGYSPDRHESFDFMSDLPLDDPDVVRGRPLHGPNRWPAECPWLRTAAEEYLDAAIKLSKQLLRVFAVSLGLEQDFFSAFCKKPLVQARLLHYPPRINDAEDALYGVAPHTDFGMITVLVQDAVGGLEVQKRDGEWIRAPHIPETFVVNLGDLFRVWTNDIYVSNPHRVVCHSNSDRYSIPVFFNLDYDTPVRCLETCRVAGAEPKYEPTTSGEYLLLRYKAVLKYDAPA